MPRKEMIGRVISDKMQKTITVLVEERVQHPRYKKYITRRAKFYAHDEHEEARVGDIVRIIESRPLSRLKRWRLVEVLRRAEAPELVTEEAELPLEPEVEAELGAGSKPEPESEPEPELEPEEEEKEATPESETQLEPKPEERLETEG